MRAGRAAGLGSGVKEKWQEVRSARNAASQLALETVYACVRLHSDQNLPELFRCSLKTLIVQKVKAAWHYLLENKHSLYAPGPNQGSSAHTVTATPATFMAGVLYSCYTRFSHIGLGCVAFSPYRFQ